MTKYTEKKKRAQAVLEYIETHLTFKVYAGVQKCGSWLEMKADKELVNVKLNRANFCNNRFCPMCAWRMAQKDALRVSVIMDYIEREHDKAFVMLTLTAPNVKGDKLSEEITRFNTAFKNLTKRPEVLKMHSGYIRKLEVTYNAKRDDYHPHFHAIFAVNKSYFTSRDYLSQKKWLQLWRDVMRDESITQVWVQKVVKELGADERDFKNVTEGKSVREIAKYAAKDEDYTHSQEVFDYFYTALRGRQILTYSGLFAEANKKFKDGELEGYKPIDKTDYYWIIFFRWAGSAYKELSRREMTIDEKWKLPLRCEELPVEW